MREKSYNTTYTTVKIGQINGISFSNIPTTELSLGTINATVNFGNINGIRPNIPQFAPSGLMSIPNKNDKVIAVNMGIGQSQYAIIGYMYNYVDDRIKIQNQGEVSIFSNEYFINLLNNALKIEYSSINPQECSLPIGEATQQIFKDILNEILNNLTTYINSQIQASLNNFATLFNNHTHIISGIQTGTSTVTSSGPPSSVPSVGIYVPTAAIATDYNYVLAGKLLISENGTTIIT